MWRHRGAAEDEAEPESAVAGSTHADSETKSMTSPCPASCHVAHVARCRFFACPDGTPLRRSPDAALDEVSVTRDVERVLRSDLQSRDDRTHNFVVARLYAI